ncbi:MAG: SNF2-related protein, partial [Oscillospiraceae bacterium]
MIFTPHPYQQYCVDRVVSDPYIGLLLDMGLGKTVITLTAIAELRFNRWAVRRVLIVAPKRVAEATWQKEAAKWDHL